MSRHGYSPRIPVPPKEIISAEKRDEWIKEKGADSSSVPQEFIMDWYKDSYDYQRIHSDEELKEFLRLTPEQIFEWLEGAMIFVWEAKTR